MADQTREPATRMFCSYAREDDQAFSESIRHLLRDLKSMFRSETGRDLEIFFDRDAIGWGDDIRDSIGVSVENATYLLPIISARYFQRDWCRDELLAFYGKTRTLGLTDLILPIVFAGKSTIKEDSEDEVVRIVARVKYIDWTDTWQHGPGSAAWNLAVTSLVRRLAARQGPVERRLAKREEMFNRPLEAAHIDAHTLLDVEIPGQEPQTLMNQTLDAMKAREVTSQVETFILGFQDFLAHLGESVGEPRLSADMTEVPTLDRLSEEASFLGRELEQASRGALEEVIELDNRLRTAIRGLRLSAPIALRASLGDELRRYRDDWIRVATLIREVDDMSAVLGRLAESSIRLRLALSPARAALQAMRDLARIMDSWISLEP